MRHRRPKAIARARGLAMPSRVLTLMAMMWMIAVVPAATAQDEPQEEAAPAATVVMTDRQEFIPFFVTIQQGETVEWRNISQLHHTVTADPDEVTLTNNVILPEGAEPFRSHTIQPGETYRHTFEVPGTYQYVCLPHEPANMIGRVIVEERQQ